MAVTLTNADYLAIQRGDYDFLNNKGAKYYTDGDYENAVEYYRLAAAMGSVQSVSNLGYCYMYGRSIEKNMSLAMAYFRAAAQKNDIDALYKLGDIYEKGTDGIEKDEEAAAYYYTLAIQKVHETRYDEADRYPSLYLSVAKAHMPGGIMPCNVKDAYRYLQMARYGFEVEEAEGVKYHKDAYKETLRLLEDPCFDNIREELEGEMFDDDDEI